jgi:hypothetical protein
MTGLAITLAVLAATPMNVDIRHDEELLRRVEGREQLPSSSNYPVFKGPAAL